MMRSGEDGVAVFGPAIAALEQEAHELDRRAAAARALIQRLRDHAGVAAAVKAPRQNQVSRKSDPKAERGRQQVAKTMGRKQPAPGASVASTEARAVAELKKLAAEVAKLDGLVKAGKDAVVIKDHVAAMLRAERRAGELLIVLAGKVKDLPIKKPQRQKWYRVAALSPKQFGEKLEREAKAALAALDGSQPSAEPPPPKRNVGPSPPVAKLSAWHTDETGALSRELSAT